MENREVLNMKLQEIKSLLPKRRWKSYHLLSIDNFIYHLESLKNEKIKTRISNEILAYLNIVEVSVEENADRNIYNSSAFKSLFKYIYKISDPYRDDHGFVKRPSYPILVIVLGIWYLFLKISFSRVQSLLITIISAIITVIYYFIKSKQRKVY